MQAKSKEILEAALKLPEEERLDIASRLLDTIAEESIGLTLDDPNLLDELRARSADRTGTIPWAELRDNF
jgi:putative addiction module component (TIGR02574 family)